jgi:hypothetical protein
MKNKGLIMLFIPIGLILLGTLIMIAGGVNNCAGCTAVEAITIAMASWGWVGAILVIIGGLGFIIRIVIGIVNLFKGY